MKNIFLRTSIFSFLCLLFLEDALFYAEAEYISPATVAVRTENYVPDFLFLPQGQYTYEITWQGIKMAVATVTLKQRVKKEQELVDISIHVKSVSVVKWIYALEFTGRAIFDAKTFAPRYFKTHQTENSKYSSRELIFKDDGVVHSKRVRKGKKPDVLSFSPNNRMRDPVSAAFYMRSLNLEINKSYDVDVFNARHRYIISFRPDKHEDITVGSKKYAALRITPTVNRLTDTESEKRLRTVNIWVSNDNSRFILRLKSEVWIGSVTANMTAYTPLSNLATDLQDPQMKLSLSFQEDTEEDDHKKD